MSLLPLTLVRRLAKTVGWLVGWLPVSVTRVTRTNVQLCFPELAPPARRRLVRSSLAETACLIGELGMLFRWPEARWLPLASNAETSALTAALAADRGVLILAPHFGNWEYLALYLGRLGVMGAYERPHLQALDGPLRTARERAGMRMWPMDGGGLRAAYRGLGAGEALILLPDQVPRRTAGVYAPFFGQPALTMTLAYRLAQRTQAQVLLGWARRSGTGFELGFVPLAEPGLDSTAEAWTAGLNREFEALVRTAPAQYQWEYKRFRRPPPGRPNPYQGR